MAISMVAYKQIPYKTGSWEFYIWTPKHQEESDTGYWNFKAHPLLTHFLQQGYIFLREPLPGDQTFMSLWAPFLFKPSQCAHIYPCKCACRSHMSTLDVFLSSPKLIFWDEAPCWTCSSLIRWYCWPVSGSSASLSTQYFHLQFFVWFSMCLHSTYLVHLATV